MNRIIKCAQVFAVIIFIGGLFCRPSVMAIRLVCNQSRDKIGAAKKIQVTVTSRRSNKALLASSLTFSFDHELGGQLLEWISNPEPVVKFIAPFKKNKRLLLLPAQVSVHLDQAFSFEDFTQSPGVLHVTGILLDQNNRCSPFYTSLCFPKNRHGLMKQSVYRNGGSAPCKKSGLVHCYAQSLHEEFVIFKDLEDLWQKFIIALKGFLNTLARLWWPLLLGVSLFCFFCIHRFLRLLDYAASKERKEINVLMVFVFVITGCFLYWLALQVTRAVWLTALGGVSLIASIYFLNKGHKKSIWGKLYLMLGFIFGVLIFPFLTYSLLVACGFAVVKF